MMNESTNTIRKPYFDESGKPCLESSVIVVTDILGYTQMTLEAFQKGSEQPLLIKISDALNSALRSLVDPSGAKWFTKPLSDNIISGFPFIGAGNGAFEFRQACHCVGHFQRELAVKGFFVRGGIAVGTFHLSENLVFGQAINELINAERFASNPRIVLLKSAMDYLSTHLDTRKLLQEDDILWDEDDARFINYLLPLKRGKDSQIVKEVLDHKHHIESNLVKYKHYVEYFNVYEKYLWSAKYHNDFCNSSQFLRNKDFGIVL